MIGKNPLPLPALLDLGSAATQTKGATMGLTDMGGGQRMPADGISED